MIDLYYWTTPNCHKVTMLAEELGIPYRIVPVNIQKGEQLTPEYLRISHNGRVPAIVDTTPTGGGEAISMFESGAILLYLADKFGGLIATEPHRRADVLQWLFWQMAGPGPMMGQNWHFRNAAPEKLPYAIERYANEVRRLYGVLDARLADRTHVAGEDYSIADIALYPGVVTYQRLGESFDELPHLHRWFEAARVRPATVRAYERAAEINPNTANRYSAEALRTLYGQTDEQVKAYNARMDERS